jgi:metal-responsive CopG/Arc/MetJ family transcriptional regulator
MGKPGMEEKTTISIDRDLMQRIKQLASADGITEVDVVRDALKEYLHERENGETCYDRAVCAGLIGCVCDAPTVLSTNPKYMEGFGRA